MARKNKSQLETIYNKATQLGKENSVMKVAELLGYKNIFTFIAVRLTFTIFLQHIDIRYNNQLISFRDSKF
jgi:hypothetical protein